MRRVLIIAALAGSAGPAAAAAPPTFTKDVAPILFANCSTCHRADEVGPFPLATYEDARKRAKQIARVVGDRTMPPWKPDPGHGSFQDDRSLTKEQIAAVEGWAAAGAPQGDPNDLPKKPTYPTGWHLGKPDVVLKVAKPYRIPAEGNDVYVHFVLPLNLAKDRHVRAVQVRPKNRRVSHHGVPILDTSGTARKLAAKHGGDHYPNFGGPGFLAAGFLPGYAPGMMTRADDADDRGITLKKGTDVVLQMHYHPTGKVEFDQPEVGIYFTDRAPKRNPGVILMGTEDVDIPAGAAAHTRTDSYTVPVDFEVRDIFAHMHMIGKVSKVWAERPDGTTEPLLTITDWDFNWQDTYRYKTPVKLPKGTVLKAEFVWDNSSSNPRNPNAPPKRVTLGEGSKDEMAGFIIGGVAAAPNDEPAMWIGALAHYFEIKAKGFKK